MPNRAYLRSAAVLIAADIVLTSIAPVASFSDTQEAVADDSLGEGSRSVAVDLSWNAHGGLNGAMWIDVGRYGGALRVDGADDRVTGPSVTLGPSSTTGFSTASPTAAAAVTPGIVAAYGLEEGTGQVVGDRSGQGNDAVITGASWTMAGRYGGALSFDGTNDLVSGPLVTLGPAFTLMAWVYNPSNAAYETVVTVGTNRDVYLRNGVLTVFANNQDYVFGAAVPTGSWQHVAVTYDGTSLRGYLNGTLRGTPVTVLLETVTGVLQLGAWNSGVGNADFWQGVLDEVRAYNRALTASEIEADSSTPIQGESSSSDTTPPVVRISTPAAGAVVSGVVDVAATASDDTGVVGVQFLTDGLPLGSEDLIAPYGVTWDASTATVGNHTLQAIARDAAGNRATASATVSVATSAAPGPTGYALHFTGAGSDANRVDIRLDAPARPVDVGSGDFTIEWWMKVEPRSVRSATCQTGRDGWIWGDIVIDRDVYWAGDYGDYGVSLSADGLAFGVSEGTNGSGICGRTDLATGTWRHVAVTRRASDGRLQIFVDGRLDASGSGPTGNVSYRDRRSTQYPRDPFLVIGAEKHNVVPPVFTGLLDEIRLSTIIRYPTDFAPPSQPFTTDNYTVGLYHFDEGQGNVITDSSNGPGGQSPGTRRTGGTPPGPAWVTDTPFR